MPCEMRGEYATPNDQPPASKSAYRYTQRRRDEAVQQEVTVAASVVRGRSGCERQPRLDVVCTEAVRASEPEREENGAERGLTVHVPGEMAEACPRQQARPAVPGQKQTLVVNGDGHPPVKGQQHSLNTFHEFIHLPLGGWPRYPTTARRTRTRILA